MIFLIALLHFNLLFLSPAYGLTILKTASQDSDLFKYNLSAPHAPGFCYELMQEISKQLKDISFSGFETIYPLPRLEDDLKNKKIDIFCSLIKTKEREKMMDFFSIPLYSINHVLVTKIDDSVSIKNYDELKSFSKTSPILAQQKSALAKHLESYGINVDSGTKDYTKMFKKILADHGRVAYVQNMAAEEVIKKRGFKGKVKILPLILKTEDQFLVYQKSLDPKILSRIEEVLSALKKNGKIKELQKRYQ